ncbi:MAG TPA: beta-glucosidase BglX [Pyrinomonadaceae bacterium]|jgi:beta-glucosidase|nr:beta-glucosidase BglX [Pyrinomonadaceae bacterium]
MKLAQHAKSLLVIAVVLSFLLSSLPAGARAQRRRDARPATQRAPDDTERKVNALLARMTLEEKLGQLQQLGGDVGGHANPDLYELARRGLLGSTLGVRGARNTNDLQRAAVEGSRLHIPLIFGFDVIHGYRTIFPIPLGEAASFDLAAAERTASVAAAEARASGVHWTFAPMVDIARDARWGRIAEGAGEDPYLGSLLARARVRGFQGPDYSAPDRVVACAKHFVAYGAAEAGRDYNTTDMSEQRLREVYLPPFHAAVDAGVGTLMSAFNDLNGVPSSGNHFTLTKILRGEWKFDGFVVSDYTSVQEMIAHGYAADGSEAARLGLTAGVDMEMVSRLYNQNGAALLRQGKITVAEVDEAVRRILRVKFRAGLFEHPYVEESREASVILSQENQRAARDSAARSLVLLKNERDLLPLDKNVRRIAVVGPLADDPRATLGPWSGDGQPQNTVTLLAGIKSKVSPQTRVLYAKGVAIEGRGVTGNYDAPPPVASAAGGTNVASAEGTEAARLATTPADADSIKEAARVAREADVVVVAVGETAEMSGEAASRSTLDLPGRQLELLQAIQQTGKPYVVVLMNGHPLSLNWAAENSPAILEAWFPGTQGGPAIADALFGDVNPGGHLPVTFPRAAGQEPLYYNHTSTGRPPSNEKYTSKYLDVPVTPLFPFGHGLSYTTFRLSNLRLSATRIAPTGSVRVSVDVENTGRRAGDEVVQLYLRDVAASRVRPVKELKGFERVTLQPGERRTLNFTLAPEQLGFYDQNVRFTVEPGAFKVMAGTSSEDPQMLESGFEVVK